MRKFIVISREGGDFSMDLIFAGLVRKFGAENVFDYPSRAKHRQGKPLLVGDPEKDYGAERRSLCYTDSYQSTLFWTKQEMVQIIMNDDAWVFLDETEESYERFMEIAGFCSRVTNVVVVAGHDSFRGDPAAVIKRHGVHLRAMFVDDWKPEYDSLPKTHLINLSCNFDHLWDHSRRAEYLADQKYDVCFMGYNSIPVRKLVIDHVKQRWGHLNNFILFEERPNEFSQFIRHDDYFRIMAQSKICLNLPGASTNRRALRYYEIPYVGSCMLTCKVNTKLLHPFNCYEFDSLEQFDSLIENLLLHPDHRRAVAAADHEHCMKYHTVDARIDYVFGVLDGQE